MADNGEGPDRIQDQADKLLRCSLSSHRIRIRTEEKAKVVAAVWWTEFIQFLARLAILHQDDLKKLSRKG